MAVHPSSVSNSHFGHFLFWVLFLPLLSIVLLPLILPDQSIDPAEVEMVQTFNIDTVKLQERSSSMFSSMFITTGAMGATEAFFAPNVGVQAGLLQGAFSAKWIRGVWLIMYKMIWRWHALFWIFIIPVVALCVPAVIDGLMVRARKKYQFETSNAVFFYSSAHIATMALGMMFFLPLAPVTLSAIALFGLIIAMASAMWVTASNFQTGS
jgi:hypothetical protein